MRVKNVNGEKAVTTLSITVCKNTVPEIALPSQTDLVWVPTASFTPTVGEFTATPGIHFSASNFSPLDFFIILITDHILEHIVQEINLYARQCITSKPLSGYSRLQTPTNASEMKKIWVSY